MIPLDRSTLTRLAAKLSAGVPCGEDGQLLSRMLTGWLVATSRPTPLEMRDRLLQQLAQRLAPGVETSVQADCVRAAVRRYVDRWNRVDRYRQSAPASYAGTEHALLFECFREVDGRMPTSQRQMVRILSR